MNTANQIPSTDPDEINLLEYAYAIIKHKWIIIGITFVGLVAGYIAAKIAGPEWTATAIIAPREAESGGSMPSMSGLGMFGSMVASQLNLGGNASLEKIDLVLDSKKFNAELVQKFNLLPLVYAKQWDSTSHAWKKDFVAPNPLATGAAVKGKFLKKKLESNKTMSLTVSSKDSATTTTFINAYLEYLDEYLRTSVQKDANENREYLEKQLLIVTDPLLRSKIQELIAREVEKMMVVSKEAFSVVDPPLVTFSFKKKKLFPMVFGAGFFFMSILVAVFGHAFSSAAYTGEDRKLLDNLRREVKRMPFTKS
jgi:hypothetical protein